MGRYAALALATLLLVLGNLALWQGSQGGVGSPLPALSAYNYTAASGPPAPPQPPASPSISQHNNASAVLDKVQQDITTVRSELAGQTTTLAGRPSTPRPEWSDRYSHNPAVCRGRAVELVMCVPIARNNVEGRRAIRETWGSAGLKRSGNIALAFFVGEGKSTERKTVQAAIDHEAEKYRDIVQGRFLDVYESLTNKSSLILEWVTDYCNHSQFVLKADDDMYINVAVLLSHLRALGRRYGDSPWVTGSVQRGAVPQRDHSSKWYVSSQQFAGRVYPDYTSGTAYAMSTRAAALLHAATRVVAYFWLEDIYITGLCAGKAGVRLVDDPAFTYNKPMASGKAFLNRISGHRYSIMEIREIHRQLLHLTKGLNNGG